MNYYLYQVKTVKSFRILKGLRLSSPHRSALAYLSINSHKQVKQMSAFTSLFECKNPADQRDRRSSHEVSQLC